MLPVGGGDVTECPTGTFKEVRVLRDELLFHHTRFRYYVNHILWPALANSCRNMCADLS